LEYVLSFWNIITHLGDHLNEWARWMGPWLYVALFVVIFCETGLVVTPFLPGDSLLFAIGALCALDGSPISLFGIVPLLIAAAVLGDATNYWIGARLGPKVFRSEGSLLFNKKHLVKTQEFYERYGGKTIIIARFVPIIRTFAPFVAGIGKMRYRRFFAYNVIGGVAWVAIFAPAGFYFGNLEPVKRNFHYVIFAIIILSVMPAVIEILREWRKKKVSDVAVSPSES
jgi:membrane-associated protein